MSQPSEIDPMTHRTMNGRCTAERHLVPTRERERETDRQKDRETERVRVRACVYINPEFAVAVSCLKQLKII